MSKKKEDPNLKDEKKSVAEQFEEALNDLQGEVILDLNESAEEDDKIPLDPESGLDPVELENELNGLRDIVQDEIDKMMTENPDAEWKDIVKEAKDEKANRGKSPEKLCECCGQNSIDDDETYCEDCLETMRHYPFEWWKLIFPVLTAVLLVLSLSFFAISWPVYSQTVAAQKLVHEGKLESALEAYDKTNAEIKVTDENYGHNYLLNQVRIYKTIGIDDYEALSSFIDKYYAGSIIYKPFNKEVVAAREDISSYQKLYTVLNDTMTNAKTYNEFVEAYDKATKGKGYNEAYICYYKYYAAFSYGESVDTQLELINKIKEAAPEMKTLYLPLLAETSLSAKDYDGVLKYSEELSKVNSESPYAWWYKIAAYRLQGNIAKASNAANEALKANPTSGIINYQMGIICLLQGKTETAMTYAATAYENASTVNEYLSTASLYSLCAQLCGKADVNASILEETKEYGYEISADVAAIVNGEKTIEEVFTQGEGDFTWA